MKKILIFVPFAVLAMMFVWSYCTHNVNEIIQNIPVQDTLCNHVIIIHIDQYTNRVKVYSRGKWREVSSPEIYLYGTLSDCDGFSDSCNYQIQFQLK